MTEFHRCTKYEYSLKERTTVNDLVVVLLSIFRNLGALADLGGAIYANGIAKTDIQICLFEKNKALAGGAIMANDGSLFLYSSCFSECRANRASDNGGNAIYVTGSNLFLKFVSFKQCPVSPEECGDSVVMTSGSDIIASIANFSHCYGHDGECTFGSSSSSYLSDIKFINVLKNHDFDVMMLPKAKVYNSNFINNTFDNCFFHSASTKVTKCCFFGNTETEDSSTVTYVDCIGDSRMSGRSGIIITSDVITKPMTIIRMQNCIFCDRASCVDQCHYWRFIALSIFPSRGDTNRIDFSSFQSWIKRKQHT